MAFTPINSGEIDVGDALKKELFTKIKNDFDDHEERINNFEAGAVKIPIFTSRLYIEQQASSYKVVSHPFIANQAMSVTSCYLQIEKGKLTDALALLGDIEIDIRKTTTGKIIDADLVSIFTTKPKLTYGTDADYKKSTNQVFDTNINLNVGDMLVLDITLVPDYSFSTSRWAYPFQLPYYITVNCYGEI